MVRELTDVGAASLYAQRIRLKGPIELYDSTLRDGEQTPGVCFTPDEKEAIARELDAVGVPIIEAGFPVVSPKEAEGVRRIVAAGLDARLVALSRLRDEDIDVAVDCGVDGVLLFIASSDVHLDHKLHMDREQVLEAVASKVAYARDRGLRVQFTPEDASRTDPAFLKEVLATAEWAGAERVGVADTVGILDPAATRRLVRTAMEAVKVPVSVHLHNDLGLATANTLAAFEEGVVAAAVTVNGIGERAGNASLEEVAASLAVHYGYDCGIDLSRLTELSELVSHLTGIPVPGNKAVVGPNTFTHESGIHVAAVLEEPATYEPFPAELVGGRRNLVFGKHSGRKAVRHLLRKEGLAHGPDAVGRVLALLKDVEGPLTHRELIVLTRDGGTMQ
ncbi:MAG: homocitrate synthase family protein [Candidatus Undinarchaeales archaeon]|nr:homocitrate synthase family protein [Candidatus Undinarchaeales archaeon]MDP7494232.1 homocitrate synthase family protein [Candidatus Undinarchaeales archaeon]